MTAERIVKKTLEFDAPIERVWRAITDPAELAQWFGHEANLDALTPGADGTMVWHEHGSYALRVVEVTEPTRFVWRWVHEAGTPFDDAPSTLVEWTLSSREDGGTTLRLRESGFLTDKHQGENDGGWNAELGELVMFLSD